MARAAVKPASLAMRTVGPSGPRVRGLLSRSLRLLTRRRGSAPSAIRRPYPRYAPGACTGRSLSAAAIEQTVWEHVQALLADPEVLRQQIEHVVPSGPIRLQQERHLNRKLRSRM